MIEFCTGLKDEVLELGCKKGDLAFVKLMMNKFSCDPESELACVHMRM